MINPGQLKYKISILQHKIETDDSETGDGIPKETWPEYASLWAAKRGLFGREYYAAAAIQSENDVVYTVRFSNIASQITVDMRIKDGEKTFAIKSPPVDKDGQKRWLEIRASEMVS